MDSGDPDVMSTYLEKTTHLLKLHGYNPYNFNGTDYQNTLILDWKYK